MFRKNEFLDYVCENYFFNATTQWFLESIVDYGIEHFSHMENGVSYFVYDISQRLSEVELHEITQFES